MSDEAIAWVVIVALFCFNVRMAQYLWLSAMIRRMNSGQPLSGRQVRMIRLMK